MSRRAIYDRIIAQHMPQLIDDDWLSDGVAPQRFLVLANEGYDAADPATDFDENPMTTHSVDSPAEFWQFINTHLTFVPAEDRGVPRVHFAYDLDADGANVTALFSR